MSHEQDVSDNDAIDAERVNHTWECDVLGCSAEITEQGTYRQAWEQIKEAGWKARKEGANWYHYCPEHTT